MPPDTAIDRFFKRVRISSFINHSNAKESSKLDGVPDDYLNQDQEERVDPTLSPDDKPQPFAPVA